MIFLPGAQPLWEVAALQSVLGSGRIQCLVPIPVKPNQGLSPVSPPHCPRALDTAKCPRLSALNVF